MRELSLNPRYLNSRYHIIVVTSSVSVALMALLAYHTYSVMRVWMFVGWLLAINFAIIKVVFKPIFNDLNSMKTITDTIDTLETQVYTDCLTRVPNRQHFDTYGPESLSACRANKQPFGLIILDIDRFKSVNDTYGHLTGDEVLKIFAKRLMNRVRVADYCARIGGEEFVIMLPNHDLEQTLTVAREVHAAMRNNPFSTPTPLGENLSLDITVSVGVTVLKSAAPTMTLNQLLDHADKALYHVKRSGRDNIGIYGGVSTIEMVY